jgi:hypothetical protein
LSPQSAADSLFSGVRAVNPRRPSEERRPRPAEESSPTIPKYILGDRLIEERSHRLLCYRVKRREKTFSSFSRTRPDANFPELGRPSSADPRGDPSTTIALLPPAPEAPDRVQVVDSWVFKIFTKTFCYFGDTTKILRSRCEPPREDCHQEEHGPGWTRSEQEAASRGEH